MHKNPGSPAAAASVPDSGGAHHLPSSSRLEENDRAITWDSVGDNEHKPVSRRRSSMVRNEMLLSGLGRIRGQDTNGKSCVLYMKQACDMCRRKKIKCELNGRSKVCVQCMQRKTRCVFSSRKSRRESLKRYRLNSPGACYTIL